MTKVIYDGEATIRINDAPVQRGVPVEVEDADVLPLVERYGFRLADEPDRPWPQEPEEK